MAQQIKGKYIGNNEIDGSKVKLTEGQALRGTNSSDIEVDLIKLGASDEVLLNGQEAAYKSEVDAAQAAADAAQADINAHEALATDAHDASAISVAAVSGMVATNVQTAIAELKSDIVAASGDFVDQASYDAHVSGSADKHAASDITFDSVVASMTATDAFAAIVEVKGLADAAQADATQAISDAAAAQADATEVAGEVTAARGAEASLSDRLTAIATAAGAAQSDVDALEASLGTASGIATLDSNGKLASSQVPQIAIVDTFVVASEAAMLALTTAQQGDVAVRTDLNKSFILTSAAASAYSTLANWQELLTPTDAILSVNSQVGAVQLDADNIPVTAITDVAGSDVQAVLEDLKSQIDGVETSLQGEIAASSSAGSFMSSVEWYLTTAELASAPSASHGSYAAASGDVILVTGSDNAANRGPWVFNGVGQAYTRHSKFATAADFKVGTIFTTDLNKSTGNSNFPQGQTYVLGGAVTTLGTSPVILNKIAFHPLYTPTNLVPTGAFNLGSTSNYFQNVYGEFFFPKNAGGSFIAWLNNGNAGFPGSVEDSMAYYGNGIAAHMKTSNNAAADAAATPNIGLYTGNKTAGTGNSGAITLQSGTSAGGARGKIVLDGASIDASSKVIENVADPVAASDAATKSYVDTADNALDARLDVLESITWVKAKYTLTSADITNQYIDLGHKVIANSVSAYVDRLAIHEGASEDYTLSDANYNGMWVSRLSFLNDIATGGSSQLVAGDNIYVRYQQKLADQVAVGGDG